MKTWMMSNRLDGIAFDSNQGRSHEVNGAKVCTDHRRPKE